MGGIANFHLADKTGGRSVGGKEPKGGAMRVIDRPCGHRLEAGDDEELFRLAREHMDTNHPDMPRADEPDSAARRGARARRMMSGKVVVHLASGWIDDDAPVFSY